ncbi:MAG: CCA tRNA nucleotidyltransferase [Proteobacteria bacterium]|nr:CCA tRNA nucleotidyltransferase [Pseudomonadota bacterium]
MSILKEKFLALPETVRQAVWKFTTIYKMAGYDCYLVGGSCRDLLFDEDPHDFDFATNCPLHITRRLFGKVIPIGESHGTLAVLFRGFQFEITRYRKDVKTDGRKAVIEFSNSIEEDQKRRDLRLNALAYDPVDDKLVDSQGGIRDFNRKTIRFVGDARERIMEDHLRALRYGRLIAKLKPNGFSYNTEEIRQVIRVFDSCVLSLERIYDELTKIIEIGYREKPFLIDYLSQLHIFKTYFADKTVADQVTRKIIETDSLLPLPFAYHKNHSLKETAQTLKLPRKSKRLITVLSEFESRDLSDDCILKSMLSKAKYIDTQDLLKAVGDLLKFDLSDKVYEIFDRNIPYRIRDLAIQGEDLKKMGFEGRSISSTLNRLLANVWNDPSVNSRGKLKKLAEEFRKVDNEL